MNRYSILMTAALLAASTIHAQQAMTEAAALKQAYNGIKNNLTKMAADMPDEDYSFKATPEVRTFGALMAHIADVQNRYCSLAAGGKMPASAGEKTAKADLVSAMKESFDTCDAVIDSLTDADASKMVSMGRGSRSEFAVLWAMIVHSNEEYGYGSVYLRLKNVVPPSTAGRGRGR